VKALCDTFTRSCINFGFDGFIICSIHNIGNVKCNYKFNSMFLGVWSVIEFMHHSMHLHLIYNHCHCGSKVLVEFKFC